MQLKAIESLGRLREVEAVPVLRTIVEDKKLFGYSQHRELRIAAIQALSKIDPRYGTQALADSGLEAGEIAIAPLDSGPGCPWVRQRRYERIILPRTLSATLSSSWGKSNIVMREMSLGGGMGTRSDNLRVGSEAHVEISLGVKKIRGEVLLRRARVNEIGFEFVSMDLDSRYRLRRVLVEALQKVPDNRSSNWDGERKTLESGLRSQVSGLRKTSSQHNRRDAACRVSSNQVPLSSQEKASAIAEAFRSTRASALYATFTKIITSVNSTRDSMKARPRISATMNSRTRRRIASQRIARRSRHFSLSERRQARRECNRKAGGQRHPVRARSRSSRALRKRRHRHHRRHHHHKHQHHKFPHCVSPL